MISKKVQANFWAERMLSTIECGNEDIRRAVQKRYLADGRVNHSILMQLFSNNRIGAMFINGD